MATLTCTDLASSAVPCTLSANTVTVSLLSNALNSNFGVIISNVANSPSLKPSSTFGFQTLTSAGYFYSQNLSPSLTVTNTQTSNFISLSGVYSSLILGDSQNLTISFTPTNMITGRLIITLASSFILNSLSCLAWSGTCTISAYTLNITGTFNTSSNSITITGFKSPNTIPSDYTILNSFDSSGYGIDTNINTIKFMLNCTLPCQNCGATTSTCTTCYSLTSITTFNYYYSANSSCLTSCPSWTYINSFICTNCSNICLTCNNSPTNCSTCLSTSSFPYLNNTGSGNTCLSNCPIGSFANITIFVCTVCVSPCSQCLNTSYCTKCVGGYYFNSSGSNCLLSCTNGITITNTTNSSCDACDSVCYTCSILTTNCTACSTTAVFYQNTCLFTCPSPLVIYSGTCTPCSTICLTCSITYNNCTSCDPTGSYPFLLNFACIAVCPTFYYNTSASGNC
jgi:hypothetical protein